MVYILIRDKSLMFYPFLSLFLLCTQDKAHFEPTMKALDLGYHVLLEKPMSPNPEECIKMVEKAKEMDRTFILLL